MQKNATDNAVNLAEGEPGIVTPGGAINYTALAAGRMAITVTFRPEGELECV